MSSLSRDIQLTIIVKNCLMLFIGLPPMENRCTPLCRHADSGRIPFWERKWSSTLLTILGNSCIHKERYKMTSIKNGPHTYKYSTQILSTRRAVPTKLFNSSVIPWLWPLPYFLTPMVMGPLVGHNYTIVNLNLLLLITAWVPGNKFWTSTSRMHTCNILPIFLFLQVSMQS